MNRLVFALVWVPLAAAAEAPDFSRGAVEISLQGGAGQWALDRFRLASQVDAVLPGDSAVFVADAQGGPAASLKVGYDILGHASIDAELTATGWSILDSSRGGAGFLVGMVHWHPLQLVWLKKARPVPFDSTVFFGYGYGIAGSRRGMDGNLMELGLDATYYFSRGVGVGLYVRDVLLQFNKYYLDWDNRSLPGATVALPNGSGGSFITYGLTLDLRFET